MTIPGAGRPQASGTARLFATEGVAIAVGGWLLGIPVGYLLDCFILDILDADAACAGHFRHRDAPRR